MSPHQISPHFDIAKISPGTIEDWIDVYEDRLWGWHLQHAEHLVASGRDADFAVLLLAVACIEGYEVFRRGADSEGHSKEFFTAGFSRIFAEITGNLPATALSTIAAELYSQLRCGLFHSGATRRRVFVCPNTVPLEVRLDAANRVQQIDIDAEKFLLAVTCALSDYVRRLRTPEDPEYAELRRAFERAWHLTHAK